MTLTLTFSLPPAALHPNSRTHYMAKARAAKRYRAECAACARSQSPRAYGWKRATCTLRYTFKTARRRDTDNLMAWSKQAIDALTDAGVIEDDYGLTFAPVEIGPPDKQHPHLRITVEPTL